MGNSEQIYLLNNQRPLETKNLYWDKIIHFNNKCVSMLPESQYLITTS